MSLAQREILRGKVVRAGGTEREVCAEIDYV